MRVLIVGLLVLALGVAGVSTYLIQRFSGEEKLDELNKQAKAKTFKVLVATKPIASGSKIILDVVAWQGWEEKSLNKKFIVVDDEKQQKKRLDQFLGSIARRDIMAGEPILAEKLFKRQGAGFMAGAIQEGMRAVSIKVTAATATSGFVFPGDSVDIILTHNKAGEAVKKQNPRGNRGQKSEDGESGKVIKVLSHISETIIRNVRIIAIGNKVDQFKKKGQAMVVKTVTVEVTPKQVEILAAANAMGKMSLALRSLGGKDDLGSPRTYTTDIQVSPFIERLVRNKQELTEKKKQEAETARLKLEQDVKDRADKARIARERRTKERNKERADRLKSKDRAEIRRLQEELAKRDNRVLPPIEKPKIEVKEVKKESPPKPRTVKIYRGGSASTEEIKIRGCPR